MLSLSIPNPDQNDTQVYRFEISYDQTHDGHACDGCQETAHPRFTNFHIISIQNNRNNYYVDVESSIGQKIAKTFANSMSRQMRLCSTCINLKKRQLAET